MPQISTLLRRLTITNEELPSISTLSPPCTPMPEEAVVFQPAGHPKQAVIDGEIWPPIFKPEFVRSAKSIVPVDTDVFVCTYPKCGTTWIQHVCTQLLNKEQPEVGKVTELCTQSPMIERMGKKFCDNLKQPRLLKSHFTYRNCPKNPNAKYIFAVRNPKDCLTSYFHHNRNFKIYEWADGDFATFFELFANGQLAFGDYYDHLLDWLPHIHDENVLFLKYEDMVADLEGAVVQIGNFLGGEAEKIVNDPTRLNRIVENSQIDAMKKNQGRWFPGSVLHKETFIRKGGSRDWKNHMSREQSDRLDAIFRTRMAETEAANWWQAEMSWDEQTPAMPEITLTEAEEADQDLDDMSSISRRGSISLHSRDELHVAFPHSASGNSLVPYKPSRRGSLESVASSGYGSVWSQC